ncbi:hypothetical protein JXI42_13235 [bacterium]|nr:hypothetical protein [bacterium]
MTAIADHLLKEDYEVVFIVTEYATRYLKKYPHIVIGEREFPYNKVAKIANLLSRRRGIRMGRTWQRRFTRKWNDVVCGYLPDLLKRENVDLVLCDQLEPAVGLVCDYLGITFITICNSMVVVMDEKLPPFFMDWDYDDSERQLKINRGFYKITRWILLRDSRKLRKWEKLWGIEQLSGNGLFFATSKLATFCQQVPSLEFPLVDTNKSWGYCGPFRSKSPYEVPELPVSNKPYVYITLGSLQGSRFALLKKCAEISVELGSTPVIAHGNKLGEEQVRALENYGFVKDYVAQPRIFQTCEYAICNCGLNTVLDALSYGRPILGLPLGIEQSAIATKAARINCGITVKKKTANNIRGALKELMKNPLYKESAQKVRDEISKRNGAKEVVDFIKGLG